MRLGLGIGIGMFRAPGGVAAPPSLAIYTVPSMPVAGDTVTIYGIVSGNPLPTGFLAIGATIDGGAVTLSGSGLTRTFTASAGALSISGSVINVSGQATTTVTSTIASFSIADDAWDTYEAPADADTRKTYATATATLPGGKKLSVYRGINPAGDLASLADMTGSGPYTWTSTGLTALGATNYVRIAMRNTDGSGAEWVTATKSWVASNVPLSPSFAWTSPASGQVSAVCSGYEGRGRSLLEVRYRLNGGGYTSNGTSMTVALSSLTNDTDYTLGISYRNANGWSGETSQVVRAQNTSPNVPPTISVAGVIEGRTLTISIASLTGTPTPTTELTTLTADGVSVLGSVTGTLIGPGPWNYTVSSSTADVALVWVATASNVANSATSGGSETVPADQVVVPPVTGEVTGYVGFTVSEGAAIATATVRLSSIPANASEIWVRILGVGGIVVDKLLTASPATGVDYTLDCSPLGAYRLAFCPYGKNATSTGPAAPVAGDESNSLYVRGAPTLTCRVGHSYARPGDVIPVTLETRGWPEPTLDSMTLTLDGAPVTIDGIGNARSYALPGNSAGKTLSLSATIRNQYGTVTHTATFVVPAAISWQADTAVTDATDLATKIAAATGGEVFVLANGNYGSLAWARGLTTPIKLKAANALQAIFTGISVNSNRRSLWLENLRIDGNLSYPTSSSDCRIINCTINAGALSLNGPGHVVTGNTWNFGSTISNGVTISDARYFRFAGNTLYDCIYDQARIVGNSQDGIYEENLCIRTTVITRPNNNIHPDCLQVFGQTGSKYPMRTMVRRNRFFDTNGAQGMLLQDPRTVDFHRDMSVHDNMFVAGYTNKLLVSRIGVGCTIANNTMKGIFYVGHAPAGRISRNLASSVYVRDAADVGAGVMSENLGQAVTYQGSSYDLPSFLPVDGTVADIYGATQYIKGTAAPIPQVGLVLVTGNSHSVGRVSATGQTFNAKIKQWTQAGAIAAPAAAILDAGDTSGNFESGDLSPMLSFLNALAAARPELAEIVVVPNGQGSTGFSDAYWASGSTRLVASKNRWNAAKAAIEALGKTVVPICAVHLSANPDVSTVAATAASVTANALTYAANQDGYVDYLRANLGGATSAFPVVIGCAMTASELSGAGTDAPAGTSAGQGIAFRRAYTWHMDPINNWGDGETANLPVLNFDGTHADVAGEGTKGRLVYAGYNRAKLNLSPSDPFSALSSWSSIVSLYDFRSGCARDFGGGGYNLSQPGSNAGLIRWASAFGTFVYDRPSGTNRTFLRPRYLPAQYTIVTRVSFDTVSVAQGLLMNVLGVTAVQQRFFVSGSGNLVAGNAGGSQASVAHGMSINTIYTLAVTYDGTSLRLYRNGTLLVTAAAPAPDQTQDLYLGAQGGSAVGPLQGDMQWLAIYNRALTATELTELNAAVYNRPAA